MPVTRYVDGFPIINTRHRRKTGYQPFIGHAGSASTPVITLVGSPTYGNNLGTGSSATVQVTRNSVGAGNGLLLLTYGYPASGVGAINVSTPPTDNKSGSWGSSPLATVQNVLTGNDIEIWYCANAPGGNTTISITYSGDVYSAGCGLEVLELNNAGALQSSGGSPYEDSVNTPGTTSLIVGPMTPAVNGCFLLAFGNTFGTISASPGAPWTADNGPQAFSEQVNLCAYLIQTTAAVETATWTISQTAWLGVGVVIQPV